MSLTPSNSATFIPLCSRYCRLSNSQWNWDKNESASSWVMRKRRGKKTRFDLSYNPAAGALNTAPDKWESERNQTRIALGTNAGWEKNKVDTCANEDNMEEIIHTQILGLKNLAGRPSN